MIEDHNQASMRRRGRPAGSAKSSTERLRDRVRTLVMLNELFIRVDSVNNVNQFSSWFDRKMRRLHPGRAWETAVNNKWRKNFSGKAALTADSIDWLSELFPDAAKLFESGPGKLWQALWKPASLPDDLWNLYDAEDTPWGSGYYSGAFEALQIKVYCSYDFDEPLNEEDLGRALVLMRLNEQFGIGSPSDGVDLYLCVKALLADIGIKYASFGVFHEIVDYLAEKEHRKIGGDWRYRKAIKQCWARGQACGEKSLWEYVNNPLLKVARRAPSQHIEDRWWSLAALIHDNYQRSKAVQQKSIKAY
jgi:hypothetical protein